MPSPNPAKWFRKREQRVEHEEEVSTALETQPGLGSSQWMRSTLYPENLVNLTTFYLSYLLLLGSAVVILYFSLQKESSFTQTFEVQGFPSVVFAWNANAAATSLPPVSDTGSSSGGGRATCSPYYYDRGTRLEYACSSIATDARESLSFSLYTTIPYPATFKTYRSPYLKYPDIEVPPYYLKYYTYIGPATATNRATATAAATGPTTMPLSASATQASAVSSATLTASPAGLQARQAGSASSSRRSATASAGTPALLSIQYASASVSALVAGTIVSTMPSPTAFRSSNVVYTAKMKGGLYIYFIVVACLAVAFATPTFILVNYNLSVARKKVFPREVETPRDTSAQEPAKPQTGQNDKTVPIAAPSPRRRIAENPNMPSRAQTRTGPTPIFERFHATPLESFRGMHPEDTPAPAWTASLPQFVHSRALARQRGSGADTTAGARTDLVASHSIELQPRVDAGTPQQEEAPPAYNERDSTRGVPQWLTTRLGRADAVEEDAIEVSEPRSRESLASIDTEEATNRFRGEPASVVIRRALTLTDSPLEVRTDGSRLSMRLAWMILPTYAYVFIWDGLAFIFILIAEITAVGLVADPMVDVGTFIRSGGCFGTPADKDSVYDLQRQLCTRFLSIFPVNYTDVSPSISLIKIGGDLLAVTIALVVLFLAQLAWHIALFRKSSLTVRDGMEPRNLINDSKYTGRTKWGYLAVCDNVGSHGWREYESRD
ncbi:hypothetical protein EX895_001058 [Sporisorium graminicola]|uniref:Uncharacterized protein n=1 Tax=Sporisorium graminicola TaxID=280036 RepID=A0A4V6EUJ7_9BASI|nr:hypothetical protein EX895_001058 [Sporisorium graminicola]TKY91059.1 hypothetical protein EX895_001058 [Sporisorium graminicola]